MPAKRISSILSYFFRLEVASLNDGVRKIRMGDGFFTGYRRNAVRPDEVLISLFIPKTKANQHIVAFKQARRREDDMAIVNAAFNITFEPGTDIVEQAYLSFGGMAPTTVLAKKTGKALVGKKWNSKLVELANDTLVEELPLSADAPGGMVLYRKTLTLSLFFKAYLFVNDALTKIIPGHEPAEEREQSGAQTFQTIDPKSAQMFEQTSSNQSATDPIRRPQVHTSAYKQTTGEAIYCDDIPKYSDELYLALVTSTKAHAKILSIDASEALSMDGVKRFFSAADLTDEQNQWGPVVENEYVFWKDVVRSQGLIIGAIVADNQTIAQKAARLVKVVYEEIFPTIVTLEDAIKNKSFYPGYPKYMIKGNIDEGFKQAYRIVQGDCRLGGQEHFYLETHTCLAVPRDSDEIELFTATQHPSAIQHFVSRALNIPSSKVFSRVKRLGGGFGGKEFRSVLLAVPVALAAHKLGRPVRCVLDRDEDMTITGTRHPFYISYKVGVDENGHILAADFKAYNNAGCSMDLSFSVCYRQES